MAIFQLYHLLEFTLGPVALSASEMPLLLEAHVETMEKKEADNICL